MPRQQDAIYYPGDITLYAYVCTYLCAYCRVGKFEHEAIPQLNLLSSFDAEMSRDAITHVSCYVAATRIKGNRTCVRFNPLAAVATYNVDFIELYIIGKSVGFPTTGSP